MQYTFVCEKCGGQFYSKLDPSGWRHKVCNSCSGKPYKDYPVNGAVAQPKPAYTPRPVPTTVAPALPTKKEFNLEEYITDMFFVYATLKRMADENRFTIPEDNLCNWTTSIMIQKEKYR